MEHHGIAYHASRNTATIIAPTAPWSTGFPAGVRLERTTLAKKGPIFATGTRFSLAAGFELYN